MYFSPSKSRTIMITGAEGALGQELCRVFWNAGWEVVALGRQKCDITSHDDVLRVAREIRPDLIVNAAANNAVDKIEEAEEYERAMQINAYGPKHLAEAALELGVPFVHYSTDYVFGGDLAREFYEDDMVAPISKYGFTKAEGERMIREVGGQWYMCRVTKLFGRAGVSAGAKLGFFFLMRKLAREKPELKIVDEEGGMPTSTRDIAAATLRLIEEGWESGIYHLVNDGPCVTWYQFAEEIFALEPVSIPRIPVSADSFGVRAAKRPLRVDLRSKKFPMLRSRIEAMREVLALPKVSVVIVSMNVREILEENLREMFSDARGVSFEVIVTDNGSEDGTPEMVWAEFPQVKLVRNAYNSGFAHACNQGLRLANGEVVVFFNPDMRMGVGVLEHVYSVLMARREIGVMGVKLLADDGVTVVESVRRSPGFADQLAILLKLPHVFSGVVARYLAKDFDYSRSQVVDQVRGSFFAMRRDVLNALGVWDEERFFVWFEEIDFCQRARAAGYVVWYDAEVACVDLVGQTFKKQSLLQKQIWFSRSMVRYFEKWHPWWQSVVLKLVRPFVIIAAAVAEVMRFRPNQKVL